MLFLYNPPLLLTRMVLGYYLNRLSGDTALTEVILMKEAIHPNYVEIKAHCSCGNVIVTRSTIAKDLHLDVCSECHPFYTGKQKAAETGGRVDKFNKRFGALGKK